MIDLVRAEARKLRSTHVWLWLLLTTLSLTALSVVTTIATTDNHELAAHGRDLLTAVASGLATLPVFTLGVLAVTTEYRHQTITPTLLATPCRSRLLTAKALTYALVGAGYALTGIALELAIAAPWLHQRQVPLHPIANIGALALCVPALALFALIGLGIGSMLQNQALAVSLSLIGLAVLANTLLAIPRIKLAYPYLPTGALNALITAPDATRELNSVNLLPPWGGLITLSTWVLGTTTLGCLKMRRNTL